MVRNVAIDMLSPSPNCLSPHSAGRISTKAICLQDQKVQVNSSLCDPRTRRTVGSLLCNTQPCPA